ncbi:MAG: amino acid adenylation domain-containing protein [Lachnospiraceae bacterium]|jgi:D-alanine--poly(phosphoribitol) ligase subunit 1|nr:amino acid adenylation domain-containing protein [Lachnospiraceae bacterium]
MQNHILDYLDETALRVPDKLAFGGVRDEDGLTFSQVNRHSRAIGTHILAKGLFKEPVVVFMNRHPSTVAAFLGVLQGGCYYVPIDEEMPRVRIDLIFKNLNPRAVICDESTVDTARTFDFHGELWLYGDLIRTQADDTALAGARAGMIDTDPVYVYFTSGSTGIPKGVAGSHRALINYIEQLSEVLGFQEDTVFANQTPLYFDASLKDIFPTLKVGATAYIVPKTMFKFPMQVLDFLISHEVNTLCWVVSALTMLSAFGALTEKTPTALRTVAFVGEVFPIKQFNIWKRTLPQVRFTNLYGPTEGTGVCCYYHVEREFAMDEAIPIGRPFKNTDILLLTDQNTPAAPGEQGEICIRGTSLSLGYINDPERTAASFVQNPLNHAYPERIYRTGDIGRLNEDGDLIFVSRKDYQIKHMGHRIELGEIEANVNMLDAIRSSGCIYDSEKGKIVLFYVGDISEKDLMQDLKQKLQRYMLPNTIRQLEAMPLTATGKINRVLLKENYKKERNR